MLKMVEIKKSLKNRNVKKLTDSTIDRIEIPKKNLSKPPMFETKSKL